MGGASSSSSSSSRSTGPIVAGDEESHFGINNYTPMRHQHQLQHAGATIPLGQYNYQWASSMEGGGGAEASAFAACGGCTGGVYHEDSSNMAYVGVGKGDFIVEESYKYVGRGAGDITIRPRRSCWSSCGTFLVTSGLVALLVFWHVHNQSSGQNEESMLRAQPVPFNCSGDIANRSVAMQSYCCLKDGRSKGCPGAEEKTIVVHDIVKVKEKEQPGLDRKDFRTVIKAIEPNWSKKSATAAFGIADANKDANIEQGEWDIFAESLKVSTVFGAADVSNLASDSHRVCKLWGDPHIRTFDNELPNFYANGELWIVKSPKVYIQGRFLGTKWTAGLSCTNKIIIGGPFLKGHRIAVGALEQGDKGLTVDDHSVLQEFPGSFTLGDFIELEYNANGGLVDPAGNDRRWQKHVVHMRLPEGVYVTVFRWLNYVDMKLEMPPQAWQDGVCGNFNGNAADDKTDQITARIGALVPSKELLFHRRAPYKMTEQQMEMMRRCPEDKIEKGKQVCEASIVRDDLPREAGVLTSCMLDMCYGHEGHALAMLKKLGLFSV